MSAEPHDLADRSGFETRRLTASDVPRMEALLTEDVLHFDIAVER